MERRLSSLALILVLEGLLVAAPAPGATPANRPSVECGGDCSGDWKVSVHEIVTIIGVALGNRDIADCSRGDRNGDGAITVDEIVSAVLNALEGCPDGTPSPEYGIFDGNHPLAIFFRNSERPQNFGGTYESWEPQFSRLMGILGKVLEEEVPVNTNNVDYFTRFKTDHPNQVVLMHYNGAAYEPGYHQPPFAGHWLYRTAATIKVNVPAQSTDTTLSVSDAKLFRVGDDVGLFRIDSNGRHDWNYAEEVKVTARDTFRNTITVERGLQGTTPLAFAANAARAAAHHSAGANGQGVDRWFANLSTECPLDSAGRTFADRMVEEMGGWFDPGGVLERFDGVEFDVAKWEFDGDTDGDGIMDNGYIDGRQSYGLGYVDFIRALRDRLGPNRLILADLGGGRDGEEAQRAFGLINGGENEGFPAADDVDLVLGWSTGLNRNRFWSSRSSLPAFSYSAQRGEDDIPGFSYSMIRLNTASSALLGIGVASHDKNAFRMPADPETGYFGIADELLMGTEKRTGWLGKSRGPAVHLATEKPDLLAGAGLSPASTWLSRMEGVENDVIFRSASDGSIEVRGNTDKQYMVFSLKGIPASGPDLFVTIKAKADPTHRYGDLPRPFWVYASDGGLNLLRPDMPEMTTQSRGEAERPFVVASKVDETGATLKRKWATVGGISQSAYKVSPPISAWRGPGATIWRREAKIPDNATLRFMIALDDKAIPDSDGMVFDVSIAPYANGEPGTFTSIFNRTISENRWHHHAIALAAWAGQEVQFKFSADCGSADDTRRDIGHWADVRIVTNPLDSSKSTHMYSIMSYADSESFTSTFYFPNIGSDTVDLGFTVEGGETFSIQSITAHAAPDLMVRGFENGLVLANPSPRSGNFDLSEIAPGQWYKRIQATSKQDVLTNDGTPASGVVTVAARDALFLSRRDSNDDGFPDADRPN